MTKPNKKTMMQSVIVAVLMIFLSFGFCGATVTFGNPSNASQYVELINPDNSTYYFGSSNSTTYDYVTNAPDGWWNLMEDETGVGLVLILIFVAVLIIVPVMVLMLRRRR